MTTPPDKGAAGGEGHTAREGREGRGGRGGPCEEGGQHQHACIARTMYGSDCACGGGERAEGGK